VDGVFPVDRKRNAEIDGGEEPFISSHTILMVSRTSVMIGDDRRWWASWVGSDVTFGETMRRCVAVGCRGHGPGQLPAVSRIFRLKLIWTSASSTRSYPYAPARHQRSRMREHSRAPRREEERRPLPLNAARGECGRRSSSATCLWSMHSQESWHISRRGRRFHHADPPP
jgi:hypothetical protein